MKTFKGTKGEWKLEKEHGYDYNILSEGKEICWTGMTDVSNEEEKANAKLIAAAPDLLEALQEPSEQVERTELRLERSMSKAKEAINKAL